MERDHRLSTHGYKGLLIDRLTPDAGGDRLLRNRQELTDDALRSAVERMIS